MAIVRCDSGRLGDVRSIRQPSLVESSLCIPTKLPFQAAQTRSTIEPGSQRMLRLIGRQQTVQSSINDCSDWEVSIWSGKTSPQCGQVMFASTTNCILSPSELWRQASRLQIQNLERHALSCPKICGRDGACPSITTRRPALSPLRFVLCRPVFENEVASRVARQFVKRSPGNYRSLPARLVSEDGRGDA